MNWEPSLKWIIGFAVGFFVITSIMKFIEVVLNTFNAGHPILNLSITVGIALVIIYATWLWKG
jgi:Ca2+/H+ antiporter